MKEVKGRVNLEIKEKVLSYKDELIESIRRLVKINSIEGEEREDAPFGENPKMALREALRIAEELGFETKNINNAIGYAELSLGENCSDDYIGVI